MPDTYFGELFAYSSDLMIVLDLAGHVIEANESFLQLLGLSRPTVVGQLLVEFATSAEQPRLSAALTRASQECSPVRVGVNWQTSSRGSIRSECTFRPCRSRQHLLGIGRNLDAWHQCCNGLCKEHQAMERLIDERTRDLKRVNAELEAFNFSISHDLRAPLRAINGFSRAITEDYGQRLNAQGRDYLRRIQVNCERMSTLIDYLLQMSRLSRQELHRSRVDLGEIADSIIADLHAAEPSRNVLFSSKGAMMVEGDRELLYQLLQNLIGNAWKYTARRELGEILFSSKEYQGERVFSVVDNGVGFPVAQRDRLFMLFQRLHNPDEYEGLGIGLATAQRIVQRHGGRIWGEAVEGEQAAFHFTLQERT